MVLTKGAYPTTDSGRGQAWLKDLAQRVRPVTMVGEQLLPVPRALEPLLPDRGLRRGGTVAVDGSLALALALVAGASAAGSWVVAVGLPDLGVVAAAEAGIVLERLALVPRAGAAAWGTVVAALLDAVDVVLVRPPARLPVGVARRLAARARERRSVLLPVGDAWPIPPDLRLAVTASQWEGLGQGFGRGRGAPLTLVGFSYGASRTLDLALGDAGRPREDQAGVEAVVLFHGTRGISRPRGAGPLSIRVLGHFGQADPWEPPEQVDQVAAQLRAAGAALTMHWYAGAGHLFTDPGLPDSDPVATALAWQRTLTWLEPSP